MKKHSWTSVLRFLALGTLGAASALALFSSGEGGTGEQTSATPAGGSPELGRTLLWPQPPARPAIRFLTSILGAQEPEAQNKSLLSRLGGILFAKSEQRMMRPAGLAVRDGFLYLADPGARALRIYDLQKKSVQSITEADRNPLVSPIGVAVADRWIYLSDSYLGRVFLYDRRGRFVKAFGGGELERPTGVALDERSAKLYVTDTTAHRILIYGSDGKQERAFGSRGTGPGEFNYPTHLWFDQKGVLYVVDSLNYRLQSFHADGAFRAEFGRHGDGSGDFASPKGIATDSRGHLYVVDALFDVVQIFDQHGQLLLTFGERGMGPGQFWLPSGLFIDSRDRIYVADSYNQRVQVFEFLGGRDGE